MLWYPATTSDTSINSGRLHANTRKKLQLNFNNGRRGGICLGRRTHREIKNSPDGSRSLLYFEIPCFQGFLKVLQCRALFVQASSKTVIVWASWLQSRFLRGKDIDCAPVLGEKAVQRYSQATSIGLEDLIVKCQITSAIARDCGDPFEKLENFLCLSAHELRHSVNGILEHSRGRCPR